MKRLGVVLVAVAVSAAIGAFALRAAQAQTLIPIRGSVEARVALLEQKVAMLESQNAELRSMIQISTAAGTMTIKPSRQLVIKSMHVVHESTNKIEIKAAGDIILKGSRINLN
jgi:hypothetical protein